MTLIECIEFYQSRILRGDSRKKADNILAQFGVNKEVRKHIAGTVKDNGKMDRTYPKMSPKKLAKWPDSKGNKNG